MLENKKRALAFSRPGVGGVRGRSASHENVAMTQAQEMMMRHSLNDGTPGHTNIDPFLAGNLPFFRGCIGLSMQMVNCKSKS